MDRCRSAASGSTAHRPLRLVLAISLCTTLLILLVLTSSSSRTSPFAVFPPSHYRLANRPATFLLNATAPVVGKRPAALLPVLPPHSTQPDRRLAHLERLEELEVTLGGFDDVGYVPAENALQIERLRTCLEEGRWGGRCSRAGAGAKVVLVGYKYFACALTDKLDPEDKLKCHTAGETIWMRSMLESFKRNGVFYLAAQPEHIDQLYSWFGDIITHVWAEDGLLVQCLSNENCVASPTNPKGIPPWKLFATSWWGHPEHQVLTDHGVWYVPAEEAAKGRWSWNPLGSEWTLSPYAMPEDLTYLGYNIIGCDDIPVLPYEARQDAILLLAKKTSYFTRPEAWPLELYMAVVEATGLDIISSARDETGDGTGLPAGVVPHERMGRQEYEEFIGEMKLLLGIGNPGTSPSPYNALCQGVPVVLPYSSPTPTPDGWDLFNSTLVQHGPAALLGEPYVYSLSRTASIDEAVAMIKRAATTSIDRYVPAEMTVDSIDRRLIGMLDVDWERLARERQGGELRPVFPSAGMIEECHRLSFCGNPGPAPPSSPPSPHLRSHH